jgi:opacity protein-like surface antigen
MGMYFRFGGLATLVHTNNARNVGTLVFNQVGMKYVFSEKLMLPFWFGTGVRVDADGGTSTNFGVDLGVGLEYHFRIWRRISPFFGGGLGFDVEKPSGENNARFGFGLGPVLGVEYYIADRLSLMAQYMFIIQIAYQSMPIDSVTSFGLATLAGGAVNITYYF